jgi:hypothetical protein
MSVCILSFALLFSVSVRNLQRHSIYCIRAREASLRMTQENERVYSRAGRPRNPVSISSVTRGFSLSRASITIIGPTQ